ncbi:MAG: SDR family oxidoreductase [Desulfobacterales bacterium]|jgi:NAD(P)-dependent dehydrogenase (short-subunit alcohol dehydrogenase family)|nr:SDR family oxidoreductase [Desulfobacterales bacterium]
MNPKEISECGVVLLGGTAGVGLETAAQFAEQGARVVLLGRNPERGGAACKVVRDRVPGADVGFVQVDAMDLADTVRAEQAARDRLGAIDVLVCSTGPSHPPVILRDIPIEEVKPRLDYILVPPLNMMCAILPAMRRQKGGAIINVASIAAKVATPGETAIGAAMAAITMFSQTAALEEKRNFIRINVLTPSLIANTPGAALFTTDSYSVKMWEKVASKAHLGVPEPEDIAMMTIFLAGPAARRITGQAISINGGISVG